MTNYTEYREGTCSWKGYIEPKDRKWIIFITHDYQAYLWPKREKNGTVIGEGTHIGFLLP